MTTLPSLGDRTTITLAEGLIVSLMSFLEPIIDVYIPRPSSDIPVRMLPPMEESQKLIQALEEFVSATVFFRLSGENMSVTENIHAPAFSEDHLFDQEISTIMPLYPSPSATLEQEIHDSICDKLRPHVFNNMPIRMLVFNKSGLEVNLATRQDVFQHILGYAVAEAAAAAFQEQWKFSQDRRMTYLLDKQITDLVSYHTRYAILSHTWIRETPGDIVYSDWGRNVYDLQGHTLGCTKIEMFFAAQEYGMICGWMDTLCINKDSSSELDESIRLMYNWYRSSSICIAYLSETCCVADMHKDSWFTRGWTLQELLAPEKFCFYNKNWVNLHDIHDLPIPRSLNLLLELPFFSLESVIDEKITVQIQRATTITAREIDLCRRGEIEVIPISRKFALAAQRQVTRMEDTAYSLVGLLGVDISVAYGEGAGRALFRLQRELLATKKHILDIFNHQYHPENKVLPSNIRQYLGRSTMFDAYTDKPTVSLESYFKLVEPVVLTHLGVRLPLLLVPALLDPTGNRKVDGQTAMGSYYGKMQFNNRTYLPLDCRIFTDGHGESDNKQLTILTLGVINFIEYKDVVMVPLDCLAVSLNFGRLKPGTIRDFDDAEILRTSKAPAFRLRTTSASDRYQRHELEKHGMQIVTLHL